MGCTITLSIDFFRRLGQQCVVTDAVGGVSLCDFKLDYDLADIYGLSGAHEHLENRHEAMSSSETRETFHCLLVRNNIFRPCSIISTSVESQ